MIDRDIKCGEILITKETRLWVCGCYFTIAANFLFGILLIKIKRGDLLALPSHKVNFEKRSKIAMSPFNSEQKIWCHVSIA